MSGNEKLERAKPILFNTKMVRAILNDRKTVTRRVVKLKYSNTHLEMRTDKYDTRLIEIQNEESGVTTVRNPDGTTTHKVLAAVEWPSPYRPGDILYVRETFWQSPDGEYTYKSDYNHAEHLTWKPSIHMPREAARIFLRVTDVRVERLLDITDDGAMQEGIQYTDFGTYLPSWKMSIDGGRTFHSPQKEIHHAGYHVGQADNPYQCYPTARGAYHALWDSIIKPADRALYGWEANPWVWVIGFERIRSDDDE